MGPVIDADGHVEETLSELVEALPPTMRDVALRFVAERGGHVSYALEGRLWRSRYPFPGGLDNHVAAGGQRREGGRDPHVRLEVLDDEGIDVAVLYPSVGLMFGLHENPDVAAALCSAYNDWLARYCSADPRRLLGVALLPQQEPRLAAEELRRAVESYGFLGGVVRPNRVGGRTIDGPAFDALWQTAVQLDVPMALHEAYLPGIDTVGVDRQSSYAGCHIVSHVLEQMTAMVALVLAGVFERFSGLRLGFLEAGCGWAPTWASRIEEHYERAPGDYKGGDPRSRVAERAWLTCEIEEPGLTSTLEQGWADRVMFASDYPHHDAVYPGAVKALTERRLGEEGERKVLSGNALAFYGQRLAALVKTDQERGSR